MTSAGNIGSGPNASGYLYGMTLNTATSSTLYSVNVAPLSAINNIVQRLEKCTFNCKSTNSGGGVIVGNNSIGTASGPWVQLIDCNYSFGAVGQGIRAQTGRLEIIGGSLTGSVFPTAVFAAVSGVTTHKSVAIVDSLDMSAMPTDRNLANLVYGQCTYEFRNCKLPSGWTGVLSTTAPYPGGKISMVNSTDGTTTWHFWTQECAGTNKSDTAVYKTGGYSLDGTAMSVKMDSTADAEYPTVILESFEMPYEITDINISKTLTIDVITDNVTLTNEDCWIDVRYVGASAPLQTTISSGKSSVLASATNLTASTASWTSTGITTPVKQKVSVTFTPTQKGWVYIKLKLAKASTTLRYCPKVEVV
jgi:hypothetical protein